MAFYLLAINIAAAALFWSDNRRAIGAYWRVPERDLLILAFMGGWLGAKITQIALRHKRPEWTFALRLNGIPLVWVLLALAAIPDARGTLIIWIGT